MRMLISGKWINKNERIEIISPYTNEVVGTVPKASVSDVKEAIDFSRKYRSDLTAYERYQILFNTAQEIREREKEFATLISQEAGIALKSSSLELKRAYQVLLLSAEEAKRIGGETIPSDVIPEIPKKIALTIREPVGLISAITPFNHPLNLVVHKIGPALAANNSVILKPSIKTPLTALKFGEVLLNNGLPENMLSIVTGEVSEIGDELIANPYIDMLSFTGSVEVGEYIARKAGIKELSLELGGNAVLMVLDDADINKAVGTAVVGAFGNSGQRCTSIKRILLLDKVADEFIGKFVNATVSLKVGNPLDPETEVGTVINEKAAIYLEKVVNEAIADGAKLLCGGKREGAIYYPTILDHVSHQSRVVTYETFGPVAPMVRVKSVDEAVEITNSTIYGLQAGVFTRDIDKAFEIARRLEVGAVMINEGPGFRVESFPFGGVKKSGIGREGIKYAIEQMTNVKLIVV